MIAVHLYNLIYLELPPQVLGFSMWDYRLCGEANNNM